MSPEHQQAQTSLDPRTFLPIFRAWRKKGGNFHGMIRTVHLTHQVVEWWHSVYQKESFGVNGGREPLDDERTQTNHISRQERILFLANGGLRKVDQPGHTSRPDEVEIMMLMQNSASTRFNIVRIIEREQANSSKLPTITKYPPYESAMCLLNNEYQPFRPQNQAFSSVSSLLCAVH